MAYRVIKASLFLKDFMHFNIIMQRHVLYSTNLYAIFTVFTYLLNSSVDYCTVLYCAVLYCAVLYCAVLYCAVLYCTVLCCAVLYCAVLYCTVLYCTVL